MVTRVVLCMLVLLAVCGGAAAHRLVPNDATHTGAQEALTVEAIHVSQLVLQELAPESPWLWVAFDGAAGEQIYVQLGVPKLDRLADYRPAFAIVGPGLPETDVPFALPDGAGAMVFPSDGLAPTQFDEPFTGTSSWILREDDVQLPENGRYYLVLYHPEAEEGKAWLAFGRQEVFGLQDVLAFSGTVETVRRFHEVADRRLPLLPRVLVAASRLLQTIWGVLDLRTG